MREKPKLPSATKVGERLQVWPTVAVCTSTLVLPSLPAGHGPPMVLLYPHVTAVSVIIRLYLAQTMCLSVRFQSNLRSMLLRLNL